MLVRSQNGRTSIWLQNRSWQCAKSNNKAFGIFAVSESDELEYDYGYEMARYSTAEAAMEQFEAMHDAFARGEKVFRLGEDT